MKKCRTAKQNDLPSRRTGLDRRWIPSPGHQPERRRGQDRRAVKTRNFTDGFGPASETAPQKNIQPGIPPKPSLPEGEVSDGNTSWSHGQIASISDPKAAI